MHTDKHSGTWGTFPLKVVVKWEELSHLSTLESIRDLGIHNIEIPILALPLRATTLHTTLHSVTLHF